MKKALLKEFTKLYNNQEILSNLMNEDLFKEYSNTEAHCIEAIGKLEKPNGVNIANKLNMTRGAISKITTKLEKKELIYKTSLEDNKKEVIYKLTNKGKDLFNKHEEAHRKWEERDLSYLDTIDEKDLDKVLNFIENFNNYLESIIKEEENDN